MRWGRDTCLQLQKGNINHGDLMVIIMAWEGQGSQWSRSSGEAPTLHSAVCTSRSLGSATPAI